MPLTRERIAMGADGQLRIVPANLTDEDVRLIDEACAPRRRSVVEHLHERLVVSIDIAMCVLMAVCIVAGILLR